MFPPADLSEDRFLGGRLRVRQPYRGYRAATDPVLLASAVRAQPGETVLELGCGAGVASLCLAARIPGLALTGLERQADYAALARMNAEMNGITLSVEIGDLCEMSGALRTRNFDHVIANPPYFPNGGGTPATDPGREAAQREMTPLADWVGTALRRLKPGGWVTMIQSAERTADLLSGLVKGAGNITLIPLSPRRGRDATRVIVRARKGGKGPFRLAAPFVLHDGDAHERDGDDYSEAARAILRNGAALPV